MASETALRLWTTCHHAKMPLPTFSQDDFLNYCVVEALSLRARMREAEEQKKAQREEWKRKPLGSGS